MESIEKLFAEVLIKSIPDIHIAISSNLISDKSRKINKIPLIKDWLRYYRNSKLIFETTVIELLSMIEIKDEQQIHSIAAILDNELENISADTALIHISDDKLQFFIRIIVPCLFLYGKFPSTILYKARHGDEESIEQLARIDYSVIHDSKISQYLLTLYFKNPTRHKLLIKSFSYDNKKPEIDEIKIKFAALISHINVLFSKELNKKRISYTQIRQLFIDDAKIHGFDDDIDLPSGDDAFSRRIRRNNIWNELFKIPDKN
jgi:hypothetical protein